LEHYDACVRDWQKQGKKEGVGVWRFKELSATDDLQQSYWLGFVAHHMRCTRPFWDRRALAISARENIMRHLETFFMSFCSLRSQTVNIWANTK